MAYPSDLTDEQWAYLEPLLLEREAEQRYLGGRKRTTDLRAIVNATTVKIKSIANDDCSKRISLARLLTIG